MVAAKLYNVEVLNIDDVVLDIPVVATGFKDAEEIASEYVGEGCRVTGIYLISPRLISRRYLAPHSGVMDGVGILVQIPTGGEMEMLAEKIIGNIEELAEGTDYDVWQNAICDWGEGDVV